MRIYMEFVWNNRIILWLPTISFCALFIHTPRRSMHVVTVGLLEKGDSLDREGKLEPHGIYDLQR